VYSFQIANFVVEWKKGDETELKSICKDVNNFYL
jgi:hypothetical protein